MVDYLNVVKMKKKAVSAVSGIGLAYYFFLRLIKKKYEKTTTTLSSHVETINFSPHIH